MPKGFAHLLLLAIFAVSILGALGSYFFIFKKQSDVTIEQKLVPPLPPAEEQIKKDSIYNNEFWGIMFTIPSGFTVKEETEDEFHKRSNGDMRKNFTYYVHYAPAEFVGSLYVLKNGDYKNSPMSLWIFENPDHLSPGEFYKKYWYYPFVWGEYSSGDRNKAAPDTKFVVGQYEATGAAMTDLDPKVKFIYLSKGDKMYLFKTTSENQIPSDFQLLK